jgi:GTP-binding protein
VEPETEHQYSRSAEKPVMGDLSVNVQFVKSAASRRDFPPESGVEVAFLGRSNVGKSTLLNRLLGARLARTSKTPGRTQLINFFQLRLSEKVFGLVDLPGYGYAKVPTAIRRSFEPLVEAYLAEREQLTLALLLIDIRRGVQDEERELVEWGRKHMRAPFRIVVTKCDKLAKARRNIAVANIRDALRGDAADEVFAVGQPSLGIESLRAWLCAYLLQASPN